MCQNGILDNLSYIVNKFLYFCRPEKKVALKTTYNLYLFNETAAREEARKQ